MENHKVEVRKKINNLDEIYDGENLLLNEFINLDLSDLNLYVISKEKWENCIFYNTSFKNTGIKFVPRKLAKASLEQISVFELPSYYKTHKAMAYCDFSDNDLTYLTREDFCVDSLNEIITYGCDFGNTGINFFKTLINLKLDSSYQMYDFDSEYWSFSYGIINWPDFIDINTIIKNPFLNVPSFRILNAIARYVCETNKENMITTGCRFDSSGKIMWDYSGGDDVYKIDMVNKCEEFLKYDKQGYGKKLYNKLSPFMSLNEKFEFFVFSIKYLNVKNVDFEDVPVEVLRYYAIQNNKFENVTFNYSMNDLLKLWGGGEHFLDFYGYENEYKDFFLPKICYSSWQENPYAKKRVSDSAITFFTKVYLELSRTCNANCPFCRNDSFDNSDYDIEKIKETLNKIKKYINAVVIGGGEPTLRLNDVKKIHQSIVGSDFDWHMFSNGTNTLLMYDDYIMENFKLNLSRHAVDDQENAKIFRVNPNNIMSSNDIEKLNIENGEVTLNAVCFNGGLDSFEKIIDYIKYASDIGCKKVLIQDLQMELSLGVNGSKTNHLCINKEVLPKVREYLKMNGYREKYPIYATGGYVSYVLKGKDGFSVTIQSYINKNELDQQWPKAIKRAFDLSIDPSGNLYENWNQTTGLVKKLKKTKESHFAKF